MLQPQRNGNYQKLRKINNKEDDDEDEEPEKLVQKKAKKKIRHRSGLWVCRVTLIRCDISCFNCRDAVGATNCRMGMSHKLVRSSFVSYLRVNFIWGTVEGFLLNTNKKKRYIYVYSIYVYA